ncbi:hypothetical protein Tco_1385620 [Tanacetum coccineum]
MDLETAQTTTTAKLPILKQGEYDMWRLRIEQYFQVQDYALWDVIENGNSFKPVAQTTTNADGTSTSLIPGPVTTEEKVQKKNDVKARSMLLMALPNEHLMTFNQYKDAKTLFAAIQTRFGGNEATKKTQKTLLKQMYENFSAPSTESLDSIFNRLQKIRNKPDLDTMSFDDLYNNFKIIEQEVKRTASSSSSSQNMAFVSSPSSTNKINTAYRVSTANTQVSLASTQVSTASTQVSTANLSDDTVYACLSSQPNGSQLIYEDLEQIHEYNIEVMDLKWQLALLSIRTRRGPRNHDSRNRNQDSSRRTVNLEETSSKAMVAIDGAGFDWRYMADDEVPTNKTLMDFSDSEVHNDKTCLKTCLKGFETLKTQLDDLIIEFNKFEFNLATYKRGLASVEEKLVFYKKNEVIFCEQLAILKRDISYKDSELSMLKSELEKLKQEKESNQLKIEKFDNAFKSLDKLIGRQITDKSRKGVGFVSYNVVPPPSTGLFSPPKFDLSNYGLEEFQQSKFEGYGPMASKSVSDYISNEVRESSDVLLVKALVSDNKLEKKTVFPTVAKIEFVRPKQQEKPVRKPVKLIAITIKGKGWQKAVNTAMPNSAVVNAVRANQASRNLIEDMLPLGEEPKEGKLLKPEESYGFEGIIDFLNASSIRYALTVNPTIYTLCIKQFWATAKAKIVNGEVQIQALVDGKKVIVTKTSVRRALQLKDAEGTECLPNSTIFAELEKLGYENLTQKLTFYKAFFSPKWKFLIHTILQCLSAKTTSWNEFRSTMASFIICLATNQKFNFSKYIFDYMVKNLEGRVKFLMYPRFVQVFQDKQVKGMTKHKEIYVTPSHTKKVFANMKREGKGFSGRVTPLFQTMMVQAPKELGEEPITYEAANEKHVPIHSNDPLLSDEDRLKLNELMELCTNLSQRVLDLENTKTSQAAEIATLKEKVKKLERRNKSRTAGLKRLRKEDASKQGRKIDDVDVDDEEEVEVEKVVSTIDVTTVSATTTTVDELTLAQTLIEIKVAKPKAVIIVATITTTAVTRPKARGVVVQEPSEFTTTTSQPSQLPQAKDKGKAKMIEPKKPLKKKDQILIDEEIAQKLQAQLNAELEEEEKLAKQKEEDANIAEWDNVQAMIDADYELAARLQAQE